MTTTATALFQAEHAVWHRGVEQRRTAPHGPLSVRALHWLTSEPSRLDGAPGVWRDAGNGIAEVTLGADEELFQDGRAATGTVRIGPLAGVASETWSSGDRAIEIAARSGSLALRVRDPGSSAIAAYPGTPVFPPNLKWAIEARFIATSRSGIEVDTVIEGRHQSYDSPGIAEFTVGGSTHRLVLFPGSGEGRLRALFADAHADTFSLARSVDVVRTGEDTVHIDFNRATNPPCAYSAAATCPLPPAENRLPIAIPAGEKAPTA